MVQETARINFEATNLDVVEGRIKAIGGAINVLGGSIEVVVGTMGLIGIDEKVTKQFQEAATSAIAFADGAKRVFEGYKELREASELFRKAQQASTAATIASTTATTVHNAAQSSAVTVLGRARVAFNALTAAMVRNPITAVVVGLTALIAALVTFSDEQDDATDSTERLAEAERQLTRDLALRKVVNEGLILDAKLRGASEREILRITLAQLQADQILLENAQRKRKAEIGFYEALKEGGRARKEDLAALKTLKDQYEEYKDDVIAGENAIKSIKIQVMALDKAAAANLAANTKKAADDELERLAALREQDINELRQSIENLDAELRDLASQQGKVYNELSEEIIKDTTTRQSELLAAETLFWELKTESFDEGSYELLLAEEIYRKQVLAINTKWDLKDADAAEKAAEEQRKLKEASNNEFLRQSFRTQADEIANAAKNDDQRILQLREFFKEKRELYKNDENALKQLSEVEKTYQIDSKTRQEQIVSDLDELSKKVNAIAGLASTAIDSMSQIQESNQEKRLNEIEAYYQNMAQNVVGSEAEVADQLARIEAEKNDKMEKLKEEFFENQKKYRIAEVTITGLQGAFAAFVQASSTIPPPAGQIVGGVLAGLVLTAMAAQISQIKKQKYIRGSVGAGVGGGAANIGGRGGTNLGNISGGNFLQPIPNPGDPGNRTGASQNNFGFMSAPNTSPNTPIRAYVVASDVETGLEAERALNSRRRL